MNKPTLALAATLLATAAHADPIYLYGLQPNDIAFAAIGGDALRVASAGISGPASYREDTGAFLGGSMDFTTSPLALGVFASSGTESFTYVAATDSDALSGLITWGSVNVDGFGFEPFLDGVLHIAASSGDAVFTGDFATGADAAIQIFFPVNCSLADLALGGCNGLVIGTLEGGTIVDAPPGQVPEPGSLALLLTGSLMGMWLCGRKSLRTESPL